MQLPDPSYLTKSYPSQYLHATQSESMVTKHITAPLILGITTISATSDTFGYLGRALLDSSISIIKLDKEGLLRDLDANGTNAFYSLVFLAASVALFFFPFIMPETAASAYSMPTSLQNELTSVRRDFEDLRSSLEEEDRDEFTATRAQAHQVGGRLAGVLNTIARVRVELMAELNATYGDIDDMIGMG